MPGTLYAVTNRHVIEGGYPVIRLNNRHDAMEVLPLTAAQWTFYPGTDDIAVCPIGLTQQHHRFFALDRAEWFLGEEEMAEKAIGPGDEVFFLGRYVSHEGRQKNLPTARFGMISMLPFEKIRDAKGNLVDAFLIEARSLSGYSGSPVFLFVRPYTLEMELVGTSPGARQTREPMLLLLGVDLGHHAIYKPVLEERNGKKRPASPPRWVEQNSGMTCVAPAWKLSELLDKPELAAWRREREKDWMKEHGKSSIVPATGV
jgi:hypothetical protein